MIFLEICYLLVAIYVVTQLFIPLLFPKDFRMNWIFKGKKVSKDTTEAVDQLAKTKSDYDLQKQQTVEKTERELKELSELNEKAKTL